MKRHLATAILVVMLCLAAVGAQAMDLTGTWASGSGSKVYIRQIGNEIYFFTEPAAVNPYGATVAYGIAQGNELHLKWADVPKGGNRNAGIMVWTVESDRKIVIKEKTGGYGETFATRD